MTLIMGMDPPSEATQLVLLLLLLASSAEEPAAISAPGGSISQILTAVESTSLLPLMFLPDDETMMVALVEALAEAPGRQLDEAASKLPLSSSGDR